MINTDDLLCHEKQNQSHIYLVWTTSDINRQIAIALINRSGNCSTRKFLGKKKLPVNTGSFEKLNSSFIQQQRGSLKCRLQ
jgi:hypothetical protein